VFSYFSKHIDTKLEREITLGRPMLRWEGDIKVDLQRSEWTGFIRLKTPNSCEHWDASFRFSEIHGI
jgi:hypothetical protein